MGKLGLILPAPLVSCEWLNDHIEHPKLIVLDASINAPKGISKTAEDSGQRILNSRYFDLDGRFSLRGSDLPHMMPDEEQFNLEARKLGISKDSVIVVYDNAGIYSSPRIWWMFKAMGHHQIAVLDGGLPLWKEKYPTELLDGKENFLNGDFTGKLDTSYFRSSAEVLKRIIEPTSILIDARSAGRFMGIEQEPRKGLRGGHIPNSLNLPFTQIVKDHQIIPIEELRDVFGEFDLVRSSITFSCGSGLTACILALGAELVGLRQLSVYDGSWSEWGRPSDLPVA